MQTPFNPKSASPKKSFHFSSPQRSPHGTPQYGSGLPEAGAVIAPGGESWASGQDLSCTLALWDTLPPLEADWGTQVPVEPDPLTGADDCEEVRVWDTCQYLCQNRIPEKYSKHVWVKCIMPDLWQYIIKTITHWHFCWKNWKPTAYLIFWLSIPAREALVLGLQNTKNMRLPCCFSPLKVL